jgi:hypothetical protein
MPIVQKLLVAPISSPDIDADLREQLVDEHCKYGDRSARPGTASFEGRSEKLGDSAVNESNHEKDGKGKARSTLYEEIKHPNMELSDAAPSDIGENDPEGVRKARKKGCGFYFKKLDYEILRPLLIYRYEREEMHRQDDFIEMMMSDRNLLGSIYGNMEQSMLSASASREVNQDTRLRRVSTAMAHLATDKRA